VKLLKLFLIGFAGLSFFVLSSKGVGAQELQKEEYLEGKVVSILNQEENSQQLKIEIYKGSLKSETITVDNSTSQRAGYQPYQVDDKLIIGYSKTPQGTDFFFINDYVRGSALLTLFIIFVIVSLIVTKKWGLSSLLGMTLSFLVIFYLILPLITKGFEPILATITGATIIIPLTFYLSHGFNKKTHSAIAGTIFSLAITGILAAIFVKATKLTGFASEEAVYLQSSGGNINMPGIILAGILIGTLGVLDDITISQASIIFKLKETNPKLTFDRLYTKAMSVGRDHITSMVNTLILVYAGASMPLLLLFINNPQPLLQVVNYELIAEEIIRMLVGSIGLVLSVPVTTLLAAIYASKNT